MLKIAIKSLVAMLLSINNNSKMDTPRNSLINKDKIVATIPIKTISNSLNNHNLSLMVTILMTLGLMKSQLLQIRLITIIITHRKNSLQTIAHPKINNTEINTKNLKARVRKCLSNFIPKLT